MSDVVMSRNAIWRGKYACGWCRDSGSVLAFEIGYQGAPFAFKCGCQIGNQKGLAFPRWDSSKLKKYEIRHED